MPKFSVLICTYNRHELLKMSLTALIDGTTEKPDQVVIVNGGDERADQVVSLFQNRSGVTVDLVKTVNVNLATSRNIGLSKCTGDIVAMTDDDAEIFPDWISLMKRVHSEHPEAGAVGGAVIGADSGTDLLSRIADVMVFSSPVKPAYVRTLPGVNISYKRDALEKVGFQDETLFRGEDVDFNWRIKKLGYDIYYSPEIKVIHHHRPTFTGLLNQFYMYGRAYYLVRKKWPEMYCIYPHKIDNFRAFLKAIHSVLAPFYQSFQFACKVPGYFYKLAAIPVIFLLQYNWRFGMIREKLIL